MDRRTFLRTAGLGALGATAGCTTLLAQGEPQAPPSGGPWTQATGGPGNTASAPALDSPTERWCTRLPDRHTTAPVVANDTVVVGTVAGDVLAFDLASGDQQWRRQTAGVQGAPAVAAAHAVVPGDDGRLHRYTLAHGDRAAPLAVGTSLLSPATVADGVGYVLAEPGILVAVDVRDWRVRWSQSVETRAVGKPAVANGQVAVAGQRDDGVGVLRVFDAADGAEAWRVVTSTGLSQTAVHDGARVLVAGGHRNTITSSPGDGSPDPAGVFWFGTDGAVLRSDTLDAPLWGHCSVRFLGTREQWATVSGCNGLVAYGPDAAVWSGTLPQGVVTRPLQTPDGVLVGDAQGQFWRLGRAGRDRLVAVAGIPRTPAVLDAGMVVAAGDRLYGFG